MNSQSFVKRRASFVLVATLFVALLAQLVVRLRVIELGYRVEQVRRSVLQNDSRLRDLDFRYSASTRPQVLRWRAEQELGLIALTPSRVRRLKHPRR